MRGSVREEDLAYDDDELSVFHDSRVQSGVSDTEYSRDFYPWSGRRGGSLGLGGWRSGGSGYMQGIESGSHSDITNGETESTYSDYTQYTDRDYTDDEGRYAPPRRPRAPMGINSAERYEALRRSKTYGIRRPCWYTAWTCLLFGAFLLAAAIVWVLFLPDKLI